MHHLIPNIPSKLSRTSSPPILLHTHLHILPRQFPSSQTKMLSSSPDIPQKSLKIKQEDKFFSRLVSKETSMTNPSFRVYYGGVSGAVPFMWESMPGTPKNKFCDTSLPPLTPPPSYYFTHNEKPIIKKHSKSKLFLTLIPRINLKKSHMLSSPSSSSCSSSSLNSSMSVPMTPSTIYRRRRFSSVGSSFDDRIDDEQVSITGSPNSMLCFGINWNKSGGLRGGYSAVIMKKALFSMVGRRGSA